MDIKTLLDRYDIDPKLKERFLCLPGKFYQYTVGEHDEELSVIDAACRAQTLINGTEILVLVLNHPKTTRVEFHYVIGPEDKISGFAIEEVNGKYNVVQHPVLITVPDMVKMVITIVDAQTGLYGVLQRLSYRLRSYLRSYLRPGN